MQEFEQFIEDTFIPFLREHKLTQGVITHPGGYRATAKRDKHGFYKVKYTMTKEGV